MARIDDNLMMEDLVSPITPNSAYSLSLIKDQLAKAQENMEQAEKLRIEKQNAPIVEQLQQIAKKTQAQNMILLNYNILLQEENKRQKQQLIKVEESEKTTKKEARRSRIFAYISFVVATVISIISLIVAIVK